jgi:hypothetical protein
MLTLLAIAAVLVALVAADRRVSSGFASMPEPVFFGDDGFGVLD